MPLTPLQKATVSGAPLYQQVQHDFFSKDSHPGKQKTDSLSRTKGAGTHHWGKYERSLRGGRR